MLRISISDQFSGASMSRASRQQRTMTGRLLGLEWLEPRRLLSLWAVQTLPADGVQIQSLNSLTINFDTNVYEQGFGPWQDGDVQLESVGQNSSTSVPLVTIRKRGVTPVKSRP